MVYEIPFLTSTKSNAISVITDHTSKCQHINFSRLMFSLCTHSHTHIVVHRLNCGHTARKKVHSINFNHFFLHLFRFRVYFVFAFALIFGKITRRALNNHLKYGIFFYFFFCCSKYVEFSANSKNGSFQHVFKWFRNRAYLYFQCDFASIQSSL